MLYEKAANNIPDNVDVDTLVENYRKALIMHTYQQELINQKLTSDISEQEIADYYEKNKDYFDGLKPLQATAIQRAKARADQVQKQGLEPISRQSNPLTTVWELVEYLNSKI
mgnify:CR=1 FL=1